MKQPRAVKLTRDGLPVDGIDWTAADWQDLHEAVEKVKRLVSSRHKPKDTAPETNPGNPLTTNQ
jgi:hypothetical protein